MYKLTHSMSLAWRQEGNASYKKGVQDGLSPSLAIPHLQKAINAYWHAEKAAKCNDEQASAQKNYAKACWKLAAAQHDKEESFALVHYAFKQGFEYARNALETGLEKAIRWREEIEGCLQEWYEFARDVYVEESRGRDRVRYLDQIGAFLPDSVLKGKCFLDIGQALYHQGVSDLQDGDYKSSLSLAKDCYFPVEEADRLSHGDAALKTEVEILREEVYTLTCISESVQARLTGNAYTLITIMFMKNKSC